MPTLLDPRLVALHSQHSIQSQDLLEICELATTEGMLEDFASYSFNDFLGLTIHLFLTTQSQQTREQIALQLSKFGSAVVVPLIKIICRVQSRADIQVLASQSLEQIGLYPVIIGLSQMLDDETDQTLRTAAFQRLMQIVQDHTPSVLLVLPKLVSQKTWQLLKLQFLQEASEPRFYQKQGSPNRFLQLSI